MTYLYNVLAFLSSFLHTISLRLIECCAISFYSSCTSAPRFKTVVCSQLSLPASVNIGCVFRRSCFCFSQGVI